MKLLCLSPNDTLSQKMRVEADRLSWSMVVERDRNQISQAVRQHDPDLLLVDVGGIGDLDWWKATERPALKPVIFLNQEMTEEYFSVALMSGADAFIPTHLFSPRHFEARVRSLLRRRDFSQAKRYIARLGLTVDSERYCAEVADKSVELTLTEFKILRELACEEPKIIPRTEIQTRVFGKASLNTRSLDVHVCALRKKIKPIDLDIDSVRGVGYRLSPCRR